MAKKIKYVAVAIFAALALSSCSGNESKEESAVNDTTTTSTNDTQTQVELAPEVEAKRDQANVAPGEAVVPGSIASNQVDNLSEACLTAIQPARDLQTKYKSGLAITEESDNAKINEVLSNAPVACSPEEYATWYYDEFVGWQNAVNK
jgi:hypothetical protein